MQMAKYFLCISLLCSRIQSLINPILFCRKKEVLSPSPSTMSDIDSLVAVSETSNVDETDGITIDNRIENYYDELHCTVTKRVTLDYKTATICLMLLLVPIAPILPHLIRYFIFRRLP